MQVLTSGWKRVNEIPINSIPLTVQQRAFRAPERKSWETNEKNPDSSYTHWSIDRWRVTAEASAPLVCTCVDACIHKTRVSEDLSVSHTHTPTRHRIYK